MDRLLLEGMAFFGRHGALAAERELGARFTVDVELGVDLRAAGRAVPDLAQSPPFRAGERVDDEGHDA